MRIVDSSSVTDFILQPQIMNTKKLCYRRQIARRDMLVKILLTVETTCTTNPQQIAVIQLD